MKQHLLALLFISLVFVARNACAQQRCATVAYDSLLKSRNPKKQSIDQFERWIDQKRLEQSLHTSANKTQATRYTIPLVVHVIHNGEPIGTGKNISDAQIKSQLDVLNQDFKRLNADASKTPAEFIPVAGSININFILANRDPSGLPTTGIYRIQVSQTGFTYQDESKLKAASYWPAEDYINIWVANLSDNYVGYATFPVASGLPGLSGPDERLLDGLVIRYDAFGTADAGDFNLTPKFNKGRTTSHEMGHFLGLRHIWGDDESDGDTCAGTDYVNDTPNQSVSYNNVCPSGQRFSCGTSNMYQNYMDYTNDACMNLFSVGQVSRMTTVLTNSPRRLSLLTSPGIDPVTTLAADLNLLAIDSPSPVFCSPTVAPVITIKNQGSITINSFKVTIATINSTSIQTFLGQSLVSGEQKQFTLQNTTFTAGTNTLTITASEPNGLDDPTPSNNSLSKNLVVNAAKDIIPLRQNFDGNYDNEWLIVSQGQAKKWTATATNKSISLAYNAFSNSSLAERSWLVSPTLDFSQTAKAALFFDLSYASRSTYVDELQLLSSTDCGVNFPVIQYDKASEELSPISTASPWAPATNQDWNREYVNLSSLAGQDKIRLAFVVTNGNGNNIYIDNIEVFTDDNPTPVAAEVPYSIYKSALDFSVTFNLPERQEVRLQIFDLVGQVIADQQLSNILNQTYQADIRLQASGLYIVRMQIGSQFYVTKVFVNH